MDIEEYKWNVNLVKSRYHYLKPTYEQAEKIYRYEKDKQIYVSGHYFTAWEEWDYELSVFSQFLNAKQLKVFEQLRKKSIERYEQELVESDKHQDTLNDLAYNKTLLNYYETQLLPAFFKDPFTLDFGWMEEDRSKFEYMKHEYRQYLRTNKLSILSNHFRNYRTFRPNTLKVSMLKHNQACLWPEYDAFKHQMDEPTKAVAKHLASRMSHLSNKLEVLLKDNFRKLKAFNNKNFKKYHGELKGWHVVIGSSTPEEEKEYRSILLILLDKEKYGGEQSIFEI